MFGPFQKKRVMVFNFTKQDLAIASAASLNILSCSVSAASELLLRTIGFIARQGTDTAPHEEKGEEGGILGTDPPWRCRRHEIAMPMDDAYCVPRRSGARFWNTASDVLSGPRRPGACSGHAHAASDCLQRARAAAANAPGPVSGMWPHMRCLNRAGAAPGPTPLQLVIRRVAQNCSISMGKAQECVWHLVLSLPYPHQTLPDICFIRHTERDDAAVSQSLAKRC